MSLNGGGITKNLIEVYGITGEFSVLKGDNDEPVKVKYFQTVASNKGNDESGNALELLEELKPMRERVSSEDMKDLRSLLQRDLSDYRVANDLVPYLQGKTSTVGFFPSILVALIPSEYLSSDANIDYPSSIDESNEDSSNRKLNYNDYWVIENYQLEKKIVSLGKLTVDPRKTDFIVLDGQHRANAFRYLAGAFEAATDDAKIYSAFYHDCDRPEPDKFDAELPVTIVWFESDQGCITPQLISRKLFVDVNTNAKVVSDNRNILLNDYEIGSVATTCFYSILAHQGYSDDVPSLLHGGFDCEGDKFPSDYPRMTLFSPKTLHYMMSYFLLAPSTYLDLEKNISSDMYGNFGAQISRVKDLCAGEFTDEMAGKLAAGDSDILDIVDKVFNKHISGPIYSVFSEINFLKPHFEACVKINKYIDDEAAATETDTWGTVFKGGEGLYNAFINNSSSSGKLKTYQQAVKTINTKFSEFRNESNQNYDEALGSFVSQAGLTGFFMSLMACKQKDGWDTDMINKFVTVCNLYTTDEWVSILIEYKTAVIKELSPKLWPKMRSIFLRFFEARSDDWDWGFESDNITKYNPDYLYCTNKVKRNIDNWMHEHEGDDSIPSDDDKEAWISSAVDSLKSTLSKINIELKNEESLKTKMLSYTSNLLES